MTQRVTLQQITPVTHDTYHLTFNRPSGFDFEAGQATELAVQKDGLSDEARPFTMTSLPDQSDRLEFVIKSYPDHDGMTQHIPDLVVGDQATVTTPFGAIHDHGPGTFIAGGAGVTPFIPILKTQSQSGQGGSHLIFANKSDKDIILEDTWRSLKGVTPTFLVDDDATSHTKGRPDTDMLKSLITSTDQPFYICGPGGMVDAVRASLGKMGVADDRIITEDGW